MYVLNLIITGMPSILIRKKFEGGASVVLNLLLLDF